MLPPDALRVWNGVVTSAERLSESADETRYRLLLEPKLSVLKRHLTSRLFQHQSVPDIIAAVLQHRGFSGVQYRIRTSRTYPLREYVTQYRESDFAFISRLCEEEGIWFAFEQHPEHGEVVLFGDAPAHYLRDGRLPTPYRPHGGLEAAGAEAVFALNIRHNPVLQSIRVADYNYRTADTGLAAETERTDPEALGSESHWGLHPKTPEEVQLQTALLRELDECRQTEAFGEGNDTALRVMGVFHTDRPFAEAPDGWLVLSLSHSGSRDTAYQNTFTAVPAGKVFRPARSTPRPHIGGSLPAKITAPDNFTYAHIDEMGRYRVRLPFDLDPWSPGGESRPVRLAKPYAGNEYGQHFPLHKDTEVMLSFVQGNPDRPYISGVMHNSTKPDHVPAGWNSRNVIRTWANNKLRMEDFRGKEHIKLATPYAAAQLNLGHIVDKGRDKRGENGEGFELRTDSWGGSPGG
ncbi:type VI secretion system Vgr family protein [Neisseria sp.]|uniref:type VI secretion system Vgr family protein n=1 Tax=Neisseria sp. TaxID=192066 RepID=UPI0035A19A05